MILSEFAYDYAKQAAKTQEQEHAFIVGNIYEIRVKDSMRWDGFYAVIEVGENEVSLRNVVTGNLDMMRKEFLKTHPLAGNTLTIP